MSDKIGGLKTGRNQIATYGWWCLGKERRFRQISFIAKFCILLIKSFQTLQVKLENFHTIKTRHFICLWQGVLSNKAVREREVHTQIGSIESGKLFFRFPFYFFFWQTWLEKRRPSGNIYLTLLSSELWK